MSQEVLSLTSKFVSTPGGFTSLREQAPLVRVTLPDVETPVWLITRYEDAKAALTDPRFVRDSAKLPGQDGPSIADQMIEAYGLPAEYRDYLGILVLADGEDHTRIRTLITRAFTARRINALRPRIAKITHDLYAAMAAQGEADLLESLSHPLAGFGVCELIGVDAADQPRICAWIRDYISGDPERFIPALRGMVEHCKKLIEERTAALSDDLISELIRVSQEEGDFGETEIVAIFLLLINTGIMPPAHFIADAILALLDHPDQLARLREEPELLAGRAVPELLRFTTPVPIGAPLYATEDLEFAGMPVRRGEAVTTALLGVNHDPHEFPGGADKLDIGRELGRGVGHMAFGHGPHFCIGAALARLQAEVVLDMLFVRNDGLTLAVDRDALEYVAMPGDGIHLVSLPVRL
ncbi:cytochrome P450 [Streptomyces scabiei]|uniref:cytochrome P450 n=1 Tax=Streptomyces scabiei TaxID=1930 RepID=UPI000765BF5C|nr:cytochrome P450 [Streptomyces scabiei]